MNGAAGINLLSIPLSRASEEKGSMKRSKQSVRFTKLSGMFLLLAAAGVCDTSAAGAELRRIKVSDNHHFLVYEDGSPFFIWGTRHGSCFTG
jgi:hypothetical protein